MKVVRNINTYFRREPGMIAIAAVLVLLAIAAMNVPALTYAQDGQADSVQAGEDLPGMDVVRAEDRLNRELIAEDSAPVRPDRLSFLQLLSRGGWFMFPLALLSVAVVAIGIERFLSLRRERLFPKDMVHQLAVLSQREGGIDPRQAYEVCQRFPSSAAYIVRSMLTRVGRPQMEIENAVSEASEREASRLSNLGSWLALAAAIAPLIGLLGTVWGITQAFYDTTQLVAGQNRAEALAQGIYTALVTTMCGLMIAIPAAIMAHYFENRITTLVNEIEEMIYSLLPQFERYEGKLRFTTASLSETDSAGNDDRSNNGRRSVPDPESALVSGNGEDAASFAGDDAMEEFGQTSRKRPR